MKILIADDSSDFRLRIRKLVMGHENVIIIGECDNGVDAMQMIIDKEPDMIILDIRMPLMNGIQVLKKIKEKEIETVSCILTSYPYPQYRRRCLAEGADYFFTKSKDFEKINLAIEKLSRFMETSFSKS